ncbi:MAG: ABC transporter permease [Gemmatimonadales bacterium]|nr:ABC transporter permease [Gemmatimonadales bacterium]
MMDAFRRDIRFAIRGLTRSPAFTLVAVLTLAIGIGANTAIFSVVNAVLLKPLAYADPERLISLRARLTGDNAGGVASSAPEYHDYRRQVPGIEDVAAVWPININLTGHGEPERIQAAGVTSNYFSLLGVPPALGRDFTPEDDGGRIGYVALISHDLWQRRFGGDRSVIGKTVRLDDDPMTIIGVMPRGFRHPVESGASPMELWAPVDLDNPDPNFVNDRRAQFFDLIGRVKSQSSVERVQGELAGLTARLSRQYPEAYPPNLGWRAEAVSLAERVVGDVRPALLVLLGAVGFVLLIACANVANLLLARATTRDREIAIRTALGGSRGRLIRQLLTESLLLASIGGVLGLLIALWGTSALSQLAGLYLPRAREIGIDPVVLGFTALLVLLTGVGFGLIPALQASRPDLQSVLKDAGRGASAGSHRARVRGALVVAEVAVALVLLAGAGLLLRSFERLLAVEPGFNPENLLTLQVWLPWPNQPEKGRYFTHDQRLAFYERAAEAVRRMPGAGGVALTSRLPLRGRNDARFAIEGRPARSDEPPPTAEIRFVSPNYFETMEIPLLQGTGLPPVADRKGNATTVINQTMAEEYWPGESPIGRRLKLEDSDQPWLTVVGIAGDVRQVGLEQPAREEMYVSHQVWSGQQMAMVVRTPDRPEELSAAVTKAIHSVDPEQPVFSVVPMEQVIAEASAERRFSMLLLVLFAAIALILSAIGIYGVMAYTTTQRLHEIGIRMALGAGAQDVMGLVVGQGMRLVGLGLAIGLLGAWGLSRVLTSQLYGVSAGDPATYAGVAVLLGLVALSASYLPALRATRVDPVIALRSE